MKCQRCNQTITWAYESKENDEGILTDKDYEAGHKLDCRYYKVEDGGREWRDAVANAPMPTQNFEWTEEDEARRREYKRQAYFDFRR